METIYKRIHEAKWFANIGIWCLKLSFVALGTWQTCTGAEVRVLAGVKVG